jgi:hypothetical protein
MARLIADGPGYQYLRATCPDNGFVVCRFVERLPMSGDRFLWSVNPPGVFATAAPEVRRELSQEQMRFALAVASSYPADVAIAAGTDFARQIIKVGISDFDFPGIFRLDMTAKLPPAYRPKFRASAVYQGRVPFSILGRIYSAVLVLSAGLIVTVMSKKSARARLSPSHLRITALVLSGVLINAAVCGALSGPHDRYQARAVWLVPFLGITLLFALAGATSNRGATAQRPS